MTPLGKITTLLLFVLVLSGCQKQNISDEPKTTETTHNVPDNFFIDAMVPGVALNKASKTNVSSGVNVSNAAAAESSDPDNGDEPVILGNQLANPYTVANMQQAVNILYGGNYPISATHLYVRFKPANVEQLVTLEDDEDLELQDYPMDYEVIQDGDYYQDPNLGTEDFGWLYTVVPVGYNLPAGIENEIIDSLYLPEDNEILEDMAESMAAGAQYRSTRDKNSNTVRIKRTDAQAETFDYEGEQCPCEHPDQPCPVWPDCGGGGGTTPPAPDARIPRGLIEVEDVLNCNIASTNVPLRQARVVCKRWFKIWRGYTGDDGRFVCVKKFKNKVKVIVKTKNGHAKIGKIRGIRLWQLFFPVTKKIGVFDQGAMANISFTFTKPTDGSASNKELPYWAAATTHNSVIEFIQYSTELGLPNPPNDLKIFVTNWGFARGTGSTVMFNKCHSNAVPTAWVGFFLAKSNLITAGITALATILKNRVDMTISYLPTNADYNCRLTSSSIKHIAFHELGHAQHYAQAGCDFWTSYRGAIINELTKLDQTEFHPYGTGNDAANAPIIATGEMWGNHSEYIYTNRHYGNGGGANGPFATGFTARMQGDDWQNIPGGLNCNLNAIENFNPNFNNIGVDPSPWIPQGLCYDLFDAVGESSPVIDNVSGFTYQQLFNALQPDVRNVPAFNNRLLLQNGNNQLTEVNDLFFRYGY